MVWGTPGGPRTPIPLSTLWIDARTFVGAGLSLGYHRCSDPIQDVVADNHRRKMPITCPEQVVWILALARRGRGKQIFPNVYFRAYCYLQW
jgi:hypothetical protein